jgi:hypothetical protein
VLIGVASLIPSEIGFGNGPGDNALFNECPAALRSRRRPASFRVEAADRLRVNIP